MSKFFSKQVNSLESGIQTKVMVPNPHVSYITLKPEGNASGPLQVFSYKPSQNTLLSRRILLRQKFTLEVDNTAGAAAAAFNANLCPRQFPLNKMVTNAEIAINNSPVTMNIADMRQALTPYNTSPDHRAKYHGFTASMPDYLGNRTNLVAEALINPAEDTNKTRSTEQTRNALSVEEETGAPPNTNYKKQRVYEFFEVLQHPLLSESPSDVFANVSQLFMRLNLNTEFENLFMHDGTGQAGTFTFTVGVPEIVMEVCNAPESYSIPPVIDIPFEERRMVSTFAGLINDEDSVPLTIPNTYLNRIPEYITIVAEKTGALVTDAEGLGTITGMNLRINNTSGVLSGATEAVLFSLAQRNSLSNEFSFAQNKTRGLPIKLRVGQDIPINVSPNTQNSNFDLSGTVTVENRAFGVATNFTLKVIYHFENTLQISTSQTSIKAGQTPDEASMIVASGEETLDDHDQDTSEPTGGFWKRKHWRKVGKFLKSKELKDFGKGFQQGFDGTLDRASKLVGVANAFAPQPSGSGLVGGAMDNRPSLRDLVGQGRLTS